MTQPHEDHFNATVGGAHCTFPSSIKIRKLEACPETYLNKKILIIGKRAIGKTTMIIHEIYYQLKDSIDQVLVFTSSDPDEYLAITHTDQIYEPSEFSKVVPNIDKSLRSLIILDNCGCDHNLMSPTHMRDLLCNKRITVVVADQSPKTLSASVRDMFDGVMVMYDPNESTLKRLYQLYFGICPTYDLFKLVISSFKSHHYNFLYNNLSSVSYRLKDHLTWINADITTYVTPLDTKQTQVVTPPPVPVAPAQAGRVTREQLTHIIDELIHIRNSL